MREGGPCGHEPRNILFEPRELAEPCSNPAKDCTKNNLLIIIDFKKEKIRKFKRAGIGNKILLALK